MSYLIWPGKSDVYLTHLTYPADRKECTMTWWKYITRKSKLLLQQLNWSLSDQNYYHPVTKQNLFKKICGFCIKPFCAIFLCIWMSKYAAEQYQIKRYNNSLVAAIKIFCLFDISYIFPYICSGTLFIMLLYF